MRLPCGRLISYKETSALSPSQSDENELEDETYGPECIQTVAHARHALENSEHIADKFWDIWNIEYISILSLEKSFFKEQRHNSRLLPEEGEIVLIEHDLLPRGRWNIERLVASADASADGANTLRKNKNSFSKGFHSSSYRQTIPLKYVQLRINLVQKVIKLKQTSTMRMRNQPPP